MDASDVEPWESVPRGYVTIPFMERPTSMWPRRCLIAGVGLLVAGVSVVILFDSILAPQSSNRTFFGKETVNLVSAYGFVSTTASEGKEKAVWTTTPRLLYSDAQLDALKATDESQLQALKAMDYQNNPSWVPGATNENVDVAYDNDATSRSKAKASLQRAYDMKDALKPKAKEPVEHRADDSDDAVKSKAKEPLEKWALIADVAHDNDDDLKSTAKSSIEQRANDSGYAVQPDTKASLEKRAYYRGDTLESQTTTSYEPVPRAYYRGDTSESQTNTSYEPVPQAYHLAERSDSEAYQIGESWDSKAVGETSDMSRNHHTEEDMDWNAAFQRGAGDTLMSNTTTSWTVTEASTQNMTSGPTTSTTVSTMTSTNPHSLFCWALMMPHGYEVSLVRTLLNHGAGIFTCEDWTVFSDGHVELSPGPPVRIVTEDIGSVKCDYGGPWHLALNSKVFIKVWKKVFQGKRYLKAGWTVKVDPDCVFLPNRLRKMMVMSDPDANVYFNNCDQGLHGPIEILARGGMEVFKSGIDECVEHLSHEFDQYGEDVFLRHCLGQLNVSRVDNFHLLSEDRCMWENPVKTGCVSGKVAFHPFKKPDTYFKCLEQARHPDKDRKRVRAIMKK
eukprot:CAMPEP_0172791352 /NCGR_PEP_ID=MMETSP1074-20121228/208427_1 /TAXON_ID=2916 /ORGANISM="Ceratium fusus, Strain PA161109" /LENGTH=617 /DNA_ID=CAMNT_0013628409 /DNA_START=48 /DNA_END=1901 /DNA_ORIENTATION=+